MYVVHGPPDWLPNRWQSMVCFTSRTPSWFEFVLGREHQTSLYLPPWSLSELYSANEALRLCLDRDDIKAWFGEFGGVARLCLSPAEDCRVNSRVSIREHARQFKSYRDLDIVLQSRSGLVPLMNDYLFHYIPIKTKKSPFRRFFRIKFASPQIKALVVNAIEDRNQELRRWMILAVAAFLTSEK